jgi:uncharacterized NAD(P)/FAD-binding protein YdhS
MAVAVRTIAIVGAGFSGTVLAARLLRSLATPARLILFERPASVGTGVAYAAHPHPYLLNVPAGRMSAVSEDPNHLLDYSRQRLPQVHAESYLTRAFYGEYLQHHLAQAMAAAPRHLHLERVRCEITALHPLDLKGAVVVRAHARQWLADQVILACGDPPPAPRSYAADVQDHAAYIYQPFGPQRIQSTDQRVLLIGSGPTMVDMTVAAVATRPQIELIAISRHGLLPAPQTVSSGASPGSGGHPAPGIGAGSSLRQIVSGVRGYIEALQRQGLDWRDAIMALRKSIPIAWHGLEDAERRRFLRHVRSYWDVHRHRMAPELAAKIAQLRASGQLQVRAGRIRRLVADGARVAVQWRARGDSANQQLSVDRVIDCSGADCGLSRTQDSLLRQLLDTGVASADPLGLGLRTGERGALINRDGDTAGQMFYLGPMLRAAHWEATAVGELRQHVDALAEALQSEPARQATYSPRASRTRFGFADSQPRG